MRPPTRAGRTPPPRVPRAEREHSTAIATWLSPRACRVPGASRRRPIASSRSTGRLLLGRAEEAGGLPKFVVRELDEASRQPLAVLERRRPGRAVVHDGCGLVVRAACLDDVRARPPRPRGGGCMGDRARARRCEAGRAARRSQGPAGAVSILWPRHVEEPPPACRCTCRDRLGAPRPRGAMTHPFGVGRPNARNSGQIWQV